MYAVPGLGILLVLVLWLLGLFVLYWVIRLAVRHGVVDAQRRGPGQPVDPRGDASGPP